MGCNNQSAMMAEVPRNNKEVNIGSITYFNVNGRACGLRGMLAHSGCKWENKMIGSGDWPALKPTAPFAPYGGLPILTAPDGTKMNQCQPIVRYCAMELGYYPRDPKSAYMADWVNETGYCDIYLPNFAGAVFLKGEEKVEKRKAGVEKLAVFLAMIEPYLGKHKWMAGNKLSFADFTIGEGLWLMGYK
jgi:glutathione S-transferase